MKLRASLLAAALSMAGLTCQAQPAGPRVSFNGSLGADKALLVIDGEPRTLAVGQTVKGVRLVSMVDDQAQVEFGGKRQLLIYGASPGSIGDATAAPGAGKQIMLSAGAGGHFTSTGTINGQTTQFLIDTGATSVAIGQGEADRMNLRYRDGRRVMTQTANGAVPAHLVQLASVRVGDVEVRDIEAIVIPGQMSHVLLGNSFLTRFQMKRENDVLLLELRY
ncbi:MAG: retroviral-like aspartic protease family protein [Burkholderiaceae bacterium]|nr:retroviral-like aspartic protease family protein [Burkholderiaceae bacterium]